MRRPWARVRVCSPFGRVEGSVGEGNGRRYEVVGRLRGIDDRCRDGGGRSDVDGNEPNSEMLSGKLAAVFVTGWR